MSKGLEMLTTGKKRTKIAATLDGGNALISKQEVEIIEKELRALEIIRNIGILRPYETSGGQCWLEAMCDATKLTKDNYDLLKEVLL